MNYPIWETTFVGGGTWIALIAVLHVYVAHLAVGGGLFIWLTERKAGRTNDPALRDYLRRHVWFFVYLTMVFGGVSGVGIWFIIALVNPAGTSLLIHNFVFGWAIEWVFFLGEILALLLYAYRYAQVDQRARQTLAFFYALFAWLSLFVINGILAFMLTPGQWPVTRNFWDGFLNPSFLPSLCFRTLMAVMIAGLFGFVTSVRIKESGLRRTRLRYCARWLLFPFPAAVLAGAWYWRAIPAVTRGMAFGLNPQIPPALGVFAVSSGILFVGGIVLAVTRGPGIQRLATAVVVVIGLSWMGGFEYLREISRKPFLISGYLYSNCLLASDQPQLDQDGVLSHARWSAVKAISPENAQAAGRELFNLQCLGCHTIRGLRNDIVRRTARLTYLGILAQLNGQGRMLSYMPPVMGTPAEKQALAAYIAGLSGREIRTEPESSTLPPVADPVRTPVESAGQDKYVLLAWNDLGVQGMTDCDAWFTLMPPANTLEAQLVHCGLVPELVGSEIELTYRVERGFEMPSSQGPFWDYAAANFSVNLTKDIGLSGNGLAGKFVYEAKRRSYSAKKIPVVPYAAGGVFNPFPLFTVEARDTNTGRLLAAVNVVAPVSTELGCRNCHGGGWRKDGVAGVSRETAENILLTHDRINHTQLFKDAAAGKPRSCQSCHADPALDAPGKPGRLNLSAAMHGWHAVYMPEEGARACALCHPAENKGRTRFSRGIHSIVGVTCTKCHGSMSDHALALLKAPPILPAAVRLMTHLPATTPASETTVHPRIPWVNEPDCLNCHQGFQRPSGGFAGNTRWSADAASLYRNRTDEAGMRCAACHSSPHAEYPALNPYHPARDNLQPLLYTGKPFPIGSELTCETCHLEKMENPIHHENMARPFRNSARVLRKLAETRAPASDPKP